MPTAKTAIKHPGIMAKGKKVVKSATNLRKVTRKTSDDAEYNQLVDLEDANEKNLSSSDSNDADMELFRAAFATVKSKNAKKKNAEFLKKNQELIDSAREQAEALKSAGEAHLYDLNIYHRHAMLTVFRDQLIEKLEAISQPPQNEDIKAFATLVGERTNANNDLFEKGMLSFEQVTTSYDEAIQTADAEFKRRAVRREKIRRRTIRQAHQILERGVEEQKTITDATNYIKNFERLMGL
ncbi:hypothetical protein CTheo_1366 [Ceratobasidium theobromae]|uniref:Uncharacterized protein n=1 Tax=Ceratobasidium theobromae TaxID=1582974 RepID=A0A5N5QUE3_9AGAM|nr:hypothetical protein CTheo_1366 [Ceratobasidium theobromae]